MLGLREPEVLSVLDSGTLDFRDALDSLVTNRLGAPAADLPIGRRDAALVSIRIISFGRTALIRAECERCGEQLEAELDLSSLPLDAPVPARVPVLVDGDEWFVRMPTSSDLRRAGHADDPQRFLIESCLDDPARGRSDDVDLLAAVEAAIESADPMIDVSLDMACPNCQHSTTRRFDIATHLWREIEGYGRRLTLEVHWLASRYGWTEPEVLALSPARRRAYLELDPS